MNWHMLSKLAALQVPEAMVARIIAIAKEQAECQILSAQITPIRHRLEEARINLKRAPKQAPTEWDEDREQYRRVKETQQEQAERIQHVEKLKSQKDRLETLIANIRAKQTCAPLLISAKRVETIPYDPTGWPYAQRVQPYVSKFPPLKAVFVINNPPSEHAAVYYHERKEIHVYIKRFIQGLANRPNWQQSSIGENDKASVNLNLIASDVRHELGHYVQDLLSFAINKGFRYDFDYGLGGRPGRSIQTPEFQQDQEDPKDAPYSVHHLDDVEFWTDLGNVIHQMQGEVANAHAMHQDARAVLNNTIANASFLKSLRALPQAKGKLQRALSEIYKVWRTECISVPENFRSPHNKAFDQISHNQMA